MAVTITDRRTIYDEADSTTGWTPASFGTTTADIAESTAAVAESFATTNGEVYFTGSAIDLSNTLVYVYAFNNALLTPWDSNPPPIALLLGDGTDLIGFDMAGSDRRVFNHLDGPTSWQCLVLDGDQADEMDSAGNTYLAAGTFAALDLTNIVDVGCAFDTQSKALGGGYNVAVDIIRYGNDGYRITGGATGDRGTFNEIAVADRNTANQTAHGILRALSSIAFGVQGPITWGDSGVSSASWFEDSGVVVIFEDRNISNDKYYFNVEGHATPTNHFVLTGSTITTAGPHVGMDFDGGNINTLTINNNVFRDLGDRAIVFSDNADASGHEANGNLFENCGTITGGDHDMLNTSILNPANTSRAFIAGAGDYTGISIDGYEGTAGTAGLLWNESTDPNGELDDGIFIKGTAATHAIEFGANTPSSITLTGQTYTGYHASNGNNDSTFYNNSGGALTINIAGGTGNTSYRNGASASTTVLQSVTVTITVSGKDFGVLENAAVRVEETDGTLVSQGLTNASGVYTFSFTDSTPLDVNIVVRLKGWKQVVNPDSIVAVTGLTRSIELLADPIVNLP